MCLEVRQCVLLAQSITYSFAFQVANEAEKKRNKKIPLFHRKKNKKQKKIYKKNVNARLGYYCIHVVHACIY